MLGSRVSVSFSQACDVPVAPSMPDEETRALQAHCLFYFSQHNSQGIAVAQVVNDEKCVCQCPGNRGGETIVPLFAGVF